MTCFPPVGRDTLEENGNEAISHHREWSSRCKSSGQDQGCGSKGRNPHRRVYGIWPAAQRQGEIAGVNKAGGNSLYEGTVVSNTLKVVGIDLTSAGDIDAEGKLECVVKSDLEKCVYCKIAFKENKVVGCILLGEAKAKSEILNAVERNIDVKQFKDSFSTEGFDFKKLGEG
jgi:Rubredoxin NAD+ reductase C-terminal domain